MVKTHLNQYYASMREDIQSGLLSKHHIHILTKLSIEQITPKFYINLYQATILNKLQL